MAIVKRRRVTSLKKVSSAPRSLLVGDKGAIGLTGNTGATGIAGANGSPGIQGAKGLQGLSGRDGKDGLPGMDGQTVDIEDVLSRIKKDVDKDKESKPPYPGGMISAVKYTTVTTTIFSIPSHNLIAGINIFGVNTGAPTTIYLPKKIREGVLITVKDESSSAATNNITIEKTT